MSCTQYFAPNIARRLRSQQSETGNTEKFPVASINELWAEPYQYRPSTVRKFLSLQHLPRRQSVVRGRAGFPYGPQPIWGLSIACSLWPYVQARRGRLMVANLSIDSSSGSPRFLTSMMATRTRIETKKEYAPRPATSPSAPFAVWRNCCAKAGAHGGRLKLQLAGDVANNLRGDRSITCRARLSLAQEVRT